MSLDVFGRKLAGSQASRGPPGIGFQLTEDGNFNLENKRLCNIAIPTQPNDAVSLLSLKTILQSEINILSSKITGIIQDINQYKDQNRQFEIELNKKIRDLQHLSYQNSSRIDSLTNQLNSMQ